MKKNKEHIKIESLILISNIINLESKIIADDSFLSDLENWDSLNHMIIIVTLENHFQIKFNSSELLNWKIVDDIYITIFNILNKSL